MAIKCLLTEQKPPKLVHSQENTQEVIFITLRFATMNHSQQHMLLHWNLQILAHIYQKLSSQDGWASRASMKTVTAHFLWEQVKLSTLKSLWVFLIWTFLLRNMPFLSGDCARYAPPVIWLAIQSLRTVKNLVSTWGRHSLHQNIF